MRKNGYYPVCSFKRKKKYFLRIITDSGVTFYRRVEFWNYRPHPGEITIKDGDTLRMAYRSDVFQIDTDQ
jgi:hypothetical protein